MPKDYIHEGLLSSWKEIAAYLGCDVRTCSRWEKKLSLPVYRLDDSPKSRVFAYKEEIDKWLAERFSSKENAKNFLLQRSRLRKSLYYGIPAIGLIFLLVYSAIMRYPKQAVPADFKIEQSELIIFDKRGRELWRYDTGLKNLAGENTYRDRFQRKRINLNQKSYLYPYMMISDINQDKKKEVLFSTHTLDEYGGGILFCFNHKGRLLWEFQSGRELIFGSQVYSWDYAILGINVLDLDEDGDREIILIAYHRPYFPTQLVILDHKGRIEGEYWNSGRLTDYETVDLDEDGKKELIVIGMNNEYNKGCLLVLDPANIQGSSPQKEAYYTCSELAPGSEKYYLLFPGTDVCLAYNHIEYIATINVLNNRRLSVMNNKCLLFFELNFHLEIQDVRTSHDFEILHKNAVEEGKITSVLNQGYLDNIGRGLLYYDGEDWVSEPTMNRHWQPITKK